MNLKKAVKQLLQEIGPGHMANTAYDTAWIARLYEIEQPMAEAALEWLRRHQLPDGSWGAKTPVYYHDRVICTLAAITALAQYGNRQDKDRIRRAIPPLTYALTQLKTDPAGETVAFEMLIPTFLAEAKTLDLVRFRDDSILQVMHQARELKLAKSPGQMISRHVTMAHSSEMVGLDGLHLLDLDNLQEINGSVGHSPSATAFYLLRVAPFDTQALGYLRTAFSQGGVPDVFPFDVFEIAWTLWNLALTDLLDQTLLTYCQPHLDFLENAWSPSKGVGFSAGYSLYDGDDTGLTHEVLTWFGRTVDFEAILRYEQEQSFYCFDLEANASMSTNIHILGALRQAGLQVENALVQKVLRYLQLHQTKKSYWFDKWHASPYYVTSHAIIVAAGYADELVQGAVQWILSTQNVDGSWGYYSATAEETAYCLQALTIWYQQGHPVSFTALRQGYAWLYKNMAPPYPPLWIGKCLYTPYLVVKSTILSALSLLEQIGVRTWSEAENSLMVGRL